MPCRAGERPARSRARRGCRSRAARPGAAGGEAVQGEALDAHAPPGGGLTSAGSSISSGSSTARTAPPRPSPLSALGQPPRERFQERLAPLLVAQAHAPQVAVELSPRAMKSRSASCPITSEPPSSIVLAEVSSQVSQEGNSIQPRRIPAPGACWPSRCRRRARARALQRADRDAVVAVLGVVVVLDDQPLRLGPLDQRGTALGAEHRARGELVRGGDHDHRRVGLPLELLDAEPLGVDRDRHDSPGPPARRSAGARASRDPPARSAPRHGFAARGRAARSPA